VRLPRRVLPSLARASGSPAAGGGRREDPVRPGAQGGLHQEPVYLAQDLVQRCGAGGLVMGKAKDTRQFLNVRTAALGNRAVTSVATHHGDAPEGEKCRQGMPPATCMARVRNVVSGSAQGTALGFHDLTSSYQVSRRDHTLTSRTNRE
jgi:hypothetical protein